MPCVSIRDFVWPTSSSQATKEKIDTHKCLSVDSIVLYEAKEKKRYKIKSIVYGYLKVGNVGMEIYRQFVRSTFVGIMAHVDGFVMAIVATDVFLSIYLSLVFLFF